MEKKVPNPYGKRGGIEQRSFIEKLVAQITSRTYYADEEHRINVSDDKKRFTDVAALDEFGNRIEIHQVGRPNKNGTLVFCERKAIEDIEKATGLKVVFHALKIVVFVLALSSLYYWFS